MDDSAEVMVALLLYFDPRGLSTVGMPVDVEARMADANKRQSKPDRALLRHLLYTALLQRIRTDARPLATHLLESVVVFDVNPDWLVGSSGSSCASLIS